eukprot:gene6430-biopygen8230
MQQGQPANMLTGAGGLNALLLQQAQLNATPGIRLLVPGGPLAAAAAAGRPAAAAPAPTGYRAPTAINMGMLLKPQVRYCECFASGRYCDHCNCVNCFNNKDSESVRQSAVEAILERNPNAFRPKIQTADGDTHPQSVRNAPDGTVRHTKGCNCKKSSCLKKYCECFQGSIYCTEICKCVDCKNYDGSEARAQVLSLADPYSHSQIHQVAAQHAAAAAAAAALKRPRLQVMQPSASTALLQAQSAALQQLAAAAGTGTASVQLPQLQGLSTGLPAATAAPPAAPPPAALTPAPATPPQRHPMLDVVHDLVKPAMIEELCQLLLLVAKEEADKQQQQQEDQAAGPLQLYQNGADDVSDAALLADEALPNGRDSSACVSVSPPPQEAGSVAAGAVAAGAAANSNHVTAGETASGGPDRKSEDSSEPQPKRTKLEKADDVITKQEQQQQQQPQTLTHKQLEQAQQVQQQHEQQQPQQPQQQDDSGRLSASYAAQEAVVLQEFNAILQRIIAQAEKKAGSMRAAATSTAAALTAVQPAGPVSAAAADAGETVSAAVGGTMQHALPSATDTAPGAADGKQQQQVLPQSAVGLPIRQPVVGMPQPPLSQHQLPQQQLAQQQAMVLQQANNFALAAQLQQASRQAAFLSGGGLPVQQQVMTLPGGALGMQLRPVNMVQVLAQDGSVHHIPAHLLMQSGMAAAATSQPMVLQHQQHVTSTAALTGLSGMTAAAAAAVPQPAASAAAPAVVAALPAAAMNGGTVGDLANGSTT